MRHFPQPLTREENDAVADRIIMRMAERGRGFFAVEVRGGPPFVGFVGLNEAAYALPCGPCVDVAWRLARTAWGKGSASEGAGPAVELAFRSLGLAELRDDERRYGDRCVTDVKSGGCSDH